MILHAGIKQAVGELVPECCGRSEESSLFKNGSVHNKKGIAVQKTLNTGGGMAFDLLHFLKVMTDLDSPRG